MIVWISGRAYEHARDAGACPKSVSSRRRGRGLSFAIDVADPRALAEWFEIEAEMWSGSEVDPGSRWRGLECRRTARRLRLQLDPKL